MNDQLAWDIAQALARDYLIDYDRTIVPRLEAIWPRVDWSRWLRIAASVEEWDGCFPPTLEEWAEEERRRWCPEWPGWLFEQRVKEALKKLYSPEVLQRYVFGDESRAFVKLLRGERPPGEEWPKTDG